MTRRSTPIARLTKQNVELISEINRTAERAQTRGERVADWVAMVVGSWPFIIIQSILLAIWMLLNVTAWMNHWDPYPFILLNLALSFQAAYATPILMMSQNRQNKLGERQNQLDLQINLLSEQENTEMLKMLRLLCEKAGIQPDEGSPNQALEQPTSVEAVLRQIKDANEQKTG